MKNITPEQERVNRWMLQRKVEAGAITALGLNELDSAINACQIVQQVIESLKTITEQLANATNLAPIADALNDMSDEDKIDKKILKQLKDGDAVAQTAAMCLLPVLSHIQNAQLKLQSTGWLSDRPPVINKNDLQDLVQEADRTEEKSEIESESEESNITSISLDKAVEESTPVDSSQTLSHDELKSTLSKLKSKKKRLRGKMKTRESNENTTAEEKARQLAIDEEKLAEIDGMIEEITADIARSLELQEKHVQPQPPMTKADASRLYCMATQKSA